MGCAQGKTAVAQNVSVAAQVNGVDGVAISIVPPQAAPETSRSGGTPHQGTGTDMAAHACEEAERALAGPVQVDVVRAARLR
eukprot:COSAG05_NODE_17689_length_321_cov_0.468468_1_plen_81_part_10